MEEHGDPEVLLSRSGPVAQSAISDSVSLPGKNPTGMGSSQLPVWKAKDLDKGLGGSSW